MLRLVLVPVVCALMFARAGRADETHCTQMITEVPVVISGPGVHCLAGDMSAGAPHSEVVLDVRADNVTIDLNGFTLTNRFSADLITDGLVAVDRVNVTVRNGTFRNFSNAVKLVSRRFDGTSGHLVENLRIDNARFNGIIVDGSNSVLRNNRITATGPGIKGEAVRGIDVTRAENIEISENILMETAGVTEVIGIRLLRARRVVLRDNTILDTRDAQEKVECREARTKALHIERSSDVLVQGNRILNSGGTGQEGISGFNSRFINCVDNVISGFTLPFSGAAMADPACSELTRNDVFNTNVSIVVPVGTAEPFCKDPAPIQ